MAELTREQLLAAVISGRGPAYLRGVDLSEIDLSNAGWLTEADLRQADLSQTNLARANLKEAKLMRANLQAANLCSANLDRADMSKARLNDAALRLANLQAANLQGATLIGANLTKANLREANLESADLEGANLEGADLRKARLNASNLKGVNLRGANLKGAGLLGALTDGNIGTLPLRIPSRGFAGVLDSIQISDLLQILCVSRSSVLMRVRAPGMQGAIHIRGGQVCHAETGAIQGEEAFYEILNWINGQFETLSHGDHEITTINKPLERLLVESMRQQDEKKTLRESHTHLVNEIREYLPIPVCASSELVALIENEGKAINPDEELTVEDVFDSEDESGLFCSILANDEVFIAPLDYVRPKEGHPLASRILDLHRDPEVRSNHSIE